VQEYSAAFKAKMVQKLLPPNPMAANALSRESGVSQATLSRWLSEARNARQMTEAPPKKWTAAEKLKLITDAAQLEDTALGELLRREGVHEAQLKQWRADAEASLRDDSPRSVANTRAAKRIKELEADLRRKEKALAEASALLLLKKKAAEFWGDEDDSTPEKSDE
jgi:transposase